MSDDRLWTLALRKEWPAMDRLLEESSDEVKEQLLTDHDGWHGYTALHWCAVNGAPAETVHLLLLAGPRGYVNVKDDHGMTPAIHAAINGRADVLRQLINAGADLNIRDQQLTARSLAVGRNNPDCVAIIDDHAAAATYLLCMHRYDNHHIWQCENVSTDVLHPLIVELEESEERLANSETPIGENLVRPEIRGIDLHHLHGREKGISRKIAGYIFGPKEKREDGSE